jgi:iron complex outermembrane recepter protein
MHDYRAKKTSAARQAQPSRTVSFALAATWAVGMTFSTGTVADEQTTSAAADSGNGADTGLEEVIVTATRQAQALSKVPMSVAAYTDKTLDDLSVQTVDDLSRITPGITFSRVAFGNGDQSMISIRGIQSSAGAATTAVYIDDTPIQLRNEGVSATNAYPKVFDLDRIEVLRGPQGTLFGADSEGGAIRFITPEPSLTNYNLYARNELSATQNGGENYEAGLAVGGPVVEDQLGFRLSGWFRHDGGYVDRIDYFTNDVVDPNSNSENSGVMHGSFLWKATSNLTITPSLYYQSVRLNDASSYWEEFSSPGHYESAALGLEPSSDTFSLPSLKVEWDGVVNVISNTSYFDRNNYGVNDYTTSANANLTVGLGVPNEAFYPLPGETQAMGDYIDKQNVFTQEIRLQSADPNARFNWLVGGFYQEERQTSALTVHDPNLNIILSYGLGTPTTATSFFGPLSLGNITTETFEVDHDKQTAGFANVDFRLTQQLKLSAGARVSRIEFDYDASGAGPFYGGPSSVNGSKVQTSVTPRFALSYQANPRNLFYMSAAEGFRPGGENLPVPVPLCSSSLEQFGITTPPTTYNSDSVWSYEVGAKNRLLDDRLQIETSAYHINWQNVQTLIPLNCGFSETLNLGAAVSNGFDFASQFRPTDSLTLGLAVGYNDAHYTKTIQTGTTPTGAPALAIRTGDPLGQTPWVATLSGDYRFLAFGLGSFLHADYQYSSHDSTPLDPYVAGYDPNIPRPPAVTNLNVRIGVELKDVELALFGTNLTNADPEIGRWHDNLESPLYRGITVRPRTIGIRAIVRL